MTDETDDNFQPFTVVGGREPLLGGPEVDQEISRLASLPAVRYEAERSRAAAKLGMRLAILDRLVKHEQDSHQSKQGEPEPERKPWPLAVRGDDLVEELIGDLTRYVSLEPDYAAVASFWALHTYLVNQGFITPRLAITAPQPRCGKTTLVNWLQTVVQRPLSSVNVSAAAVYHIVEALQPTLLIDEADTFLATQNELRGVLNSGHQKNGCVHRWDPRAKCIRAYPTFCACAISLIGTLPSTLQDRSVRIRLRRRRPDEKIASLRTDKMPSAASSAFDSASSAGVPISTPIRRIPEACCARAASGQAAAPLPIKQINSRRLIAPPRPWRVIVAGQAGRMEVVRLWVGNVRFGSIADIDVS